MDTNSNSTEDLKKGQGSAAKIAKISLEQGKNVAKLATKKAGTKALDLIAAGLGPEALLVVLIVIIIIAIPMVLLSAFPTGNLLKTEDEIKSTEDALLDALTNSYVLERDSARVQIKEYINENYACNASLSDIKTRGSGYFVDTNYCSISIDFAPNLESMKENIASYVSAVNGTICFFGSETNAEVTAYESSSAFEIPKFDGKVTESKDGSVELTSEAKEFYNEHSNELTNSSDENYIASLGLYSNDFFVYDEDSNRWDLSGFRISPKVHKEVMQIGVEKIETEKGTEEVPIFDLVDVSVDAWYGDISIYIYYDLSGYKADELHSCVNILESKDKTLGDFFDSESIVSAVLNEYYASYIGSTGSYVDENGNFVLRTDNRNEIFKKLLDDGTLMYVPISGLSSDFLEGESGYAGDSGFFGFADSTSAQIWKRIAKLRNEGVIGYRTCMWNCTAFAQAWFYELYGVNALYGNGRDMVGNLLSSKNELVGDWGANNFYRGSSPAPGGIFSISSPAGANHVGCVDAVDYVNKTITFSDGNTNGAANSSSTISIRRTKTFSDFEIYVKSCCAAHGNTAGCMVTYANPKKAEVN